VKLPRARRSRRGRIEIIPMIDVMLFLLATFMLASLSMQNLHSIAVNLPRGQAQRTPSSMPVTLTVTQDQRLFLNKTPVTLDTLADTLKPMIEGSQSSVIVAADRSAPSGIVVEAMLETRKAGAEHFMIAVKHPE